MNAETMEEKTGRKLKAFTKKSATSAGGADLQEQPIATQAEEAAPQPVMDLGGLSVSSATWRDAPLAPGATSAAESEPEPETTPVTAGVPEADSIHEDTAMTEAGSPCFTPISIEADVLTSFAREYTDKLNITECVAEIPMLLDYMVRLERAFGVTLPFKACGVDTITFDTVATRPDDDGPLLVSVDVDGKQALYEKIEVDGVVYLSCISESLNPEYLHRIISEAVETVYMHRKYIYTIVGPRPLKGRVVQVSDHAGDGEDDNEDVHTEEMQEFIETMKLNSYELSVFTSYMSRLDGLSITYRDYDGHKAILFQR